METRRTANAVGQGHGVVRILLVGVVAVALLGAAGCGESGPPRAAVQGTVTWEGEPIEDGTISFIPLGDGQAAKAKIVGGKYDLPKSEGAVVGTNQVQVLGLRNLGSREAGPPHPPGTMIDVTEQFIPSEYNNSSRLSVDIEAGQNTYDLDLPGK